MKESTKQVRELTNNSIYRAARGLCAGYELKAIAMLRPIAR